MLELKEYLRGIEEPKATAVINPNSSTHKKAMRRLARLESAANFKIVRSYTSIYPPIIFKILPFSSV